MCHFWVTLYNVFDGTLNLTPPLLHENQLDRLEAETQYADRSRFAFQPFYLIICPKVTSYSHSVCYKCMNDYVEYLRCTVDVSRRISCKDLGGGDCQGWLLKKKEGTGLMASRWIKYWFVLQNRNLFYYKDPEVAVKVLLAFSLSVIESSSFCLKM